MRTPGNIRSCPPGARRGKPTAAAPASSKAAQFRSRRQRRRVGHARCIEVRLRERTHVELGRSRGRRELHCRGRRVVAQAPATWVSGKQNCNLSNRPPMALQTSTGRRFWISHVALRSIGTFFFLPKFANAGKPVPCRVSRSCRCEFNALNRSASMLDSHPPVG